MANRSLAEEAAKPFIKGDAGLNIVESPGTHTMLKKIISQVFHKLLLFLNLSYTFENQIQDKEYREVEGAILFSKLLVDAFESDTLESYIVGQI